MKKFVKINSEIYQKYPEYWLKVTPFKRGEDRRLFSSEMDKLQARGKVKDIDSQQAYRIINDRFRNLTTDWIYKGSMYKVDLDTPIYNAPVHTFEKKYDNYSITLKYFLCWHHGHLFWSECPYESRVRLYKFEGINKSPGSFVKFTSVKDLKPVWRLIINKNLANKWQLQ